MVTTMRRRRITIGAALLLVLGGAACTSSAGTAPSTSTPAPSLDTSELSLQSIGCSAIDLRGPDGNEIDLTGLWGAAGSTPSYVVRQVGDCFLMVVYVPDQPEAPWTETVCDGRIGSDFRINGRCIEMGFGLGAGPFLFNQATWEVSFDDAGDPLLADRSFACSPTDASCAAPSFVKFSEDPSAWPTPGT